MFETHFNEAPTKTTFPVKTTVETTPYGNILVVRETTAPLATQVSPPFSSLMSPAAARQLIDALQEALASMDPPKGAPLSRTGDNTSRWARFLGGFTG